MTTFTIGAAQTSDHIPPGHFSEDDLRQQWNAQADEFNQWDSLDTCEQLTWAQARAIGADRCARDALNAEQETPTDEQIANLAEGFYGDPLPTVRRALELWGTLPTPPAMEGEPSDKDFFRVAEQAAHIDQDGIFDALEEGYPLELTAIDILEICRAVYRLARSAAPPAPEPGEVQP